MAVIQSDRFAGDVFLVAQFSFDIHNRSPVFFKETTASQIQNRFGQRRARDQEQTRLGILELRGAILHYTVPHATVAGR